MESDGEGELWRRSKMEKRERTKKEREKE